jgi:hypothetical protein
MSDRYKNVKPVQFLIGEEDEKLLAEVAAEIQRHHRGHDSASRALRHILAFYRRHPETERLAAIVAHEDI